MTNALLSCFDDNNNDKATKGAAWTAAEVDTSRRMALARRVCGVLPMLDGRGAMNALLLLLLIEGDGCHR